MAANNNAGISMETMVKVNFKYFDTEREMPGITAEDGKIILRTCGIRAYIDELKETVKVSYMYFPTPPVFAYECSIKDDAGRSVTAVGSVNINIEKGIARQFAPETARTRALCAAFLEFAEAEGRVYGDIAIPIEEPTLAAATAANNENCSSDSLTQEKASVKAAVSVEKNEMPDEAMLASEAATPETLGDYIVPFGNAKSKGKKLSELDNTALEWYANLRPSNATAKEAKEKAAAYLAYLASLETEKVSEDLGNYIAPVGNASTKGKKLSELSDTALEWLANLKPSNAAAKEAKEKAAAYLASKSK